MEPGMMSKVFRVRGRRAVELCTACFLAYSEVTMS